MRHSQRKASSISWEKKSSETMAKLPHTRAEMRVFYPVFRWRELAAGWRYTTLNTTRA
jgi:hypothetical protein